jgi:hypothetical protein
LDEENREQSVHIGDIVTGKPKTTIIGNLKSIHAPLLFAGDNLG